MLQKRKAVVLFAFFYLCHAEAKKAAPLPAPSSNPRAAVAAPSKGKARAEVLSGGRAISISTCRQSKWCLAKIRCPAVFVYTERTVSSAATLYIPHQQLAWRQKNLHKAQSLHGFSIKKCSYSTSVKSSRPTPLNTRTGV